MCRQLVALPFSSRSKPLRSSFLNVGSSSGFYAGHKLEKPNILRAQPDLGINTKPVLEDEMPDILRGECSPGAGVKTGSPNSKRISPPQSDFGLSPLPRTGRKLILQSIPSFPSLTPQHWKWWVFRAKSASICQLVEKYVAQWYSVWALYNKK